jgi:hypothetical protein
LGFLDFGSTDPRRALAERLARVGPPESEPAREASASALDRVTRLCHRVLADLLFQELQVSKAGDREGLGQDRESPQFPPAQDSVLGETGCSGGNRVQWG